MAPYLRKYGARLFGILGAVCGVLVATEKSASRAGESQFSVNLRYGYLGAMAPRTWRLRLPGVFLDEAHFPY